MLEDYCAVDVQAAAQAPYRDYLPRGHYRLMPEVQPLFDNGSEAMFLLNLRSVRCDARHPVLRMCQDVEKACWNAQMDFYQYLSQRDWLIYATTGGRVSGFVVTTLDRVGDVGFMSFEECMNHPDFRGSGAGSRLAWAAFFAAGRMFGEMEGVSKFAIATLTVNPLVMDGFRRLDWMFSNTIYRPDAAVLELGRKYTRRHHLQPLDESNPWFIREAFPGSVKKGNIFPQLRIHKLLPAGFDFQHRGDAMLYVATINRRFAAALAGLRLAKTFGLSVWRPSFVDAAPQDLQPALAGA